MADARDLANILQGALEPVTRNTLGPSAGNCVVLGTRTKRQCRLFRFTPGGVDGTEPMWPLTIVQRRTAATTTITK
jgi:hypothetical protein